MSVRILNEKCDPSLAEDKSLPYSAYLVWYENDGTLYYDLVIPYNKVSLFDYYWDKYREDFKGFKQSEGRVNPKLWQSNNTDKKKKRG
jgi:hypothetical protein